MNRAQRAAQVYANPQPLPDFLPEDFRYTAELLRRYSTDGRKALFEAVCSNNLNIILAALDQAGAE